VSATRGAAELVTEVEEELLLVLVLVLLLLLLVLPVLLEESPELEPPHAASMQSNAPTAPPRTTVFIVTSPSEYQLL
jgi:hypothetical protein